MTTPLSPADLDVIERYFSEHIFTGTFNGAFVRENNLRLISALRDSWRERDAARLNACQYGDKETCLFVVKLAAAEKVIAEARSLAEECRNVDEYSQTRSLTRAQTQAMNAFYEALFEFDAIGKGKT